MAFRNNGLQRKHAKKYAAFYCLVTTLICFVFAVKAIFANPVDWTNVVVCGLLGVYALYLRFKL